MPSTIAIEPPERLAGLPVFKQLDEVDFDSRAFVIVAQTGNGKTQVVPAIEALRQKAAGRKPCIAVRQPARFVCNNVASGMRKFWTDRGLDIAVRTSEDREPVNLETADIVLVSDGSLRPLMDRRQVTAFYCDEAHDLNSELCEIDLWAAKKTGIPIRIMSATIDPSRFVDYLDGCRVHEMEGRVFPIERCTVVRSREVFRRDDLSDLWGAINGILNWETQKDESTLVFVPTREMTETLADRAAEEGYRSLYIHAERNSQEIVEELESLAGQPFVAFATVAAATGVTLDIHNVIIADDFIHGTVERGVKRRNHGPVPPNTLLQMAGRAGRLRPGKAFLITNGERRPVTSPDQWFTKEGQPVVPHPVPLPCERNTPISVSLTFAANDLDPLEADIISNLDEEEVEVARRRLRRIGCIDDRGRITKFGKAVESMPLDTEYAHLVLSAPSPSLKVAALAAITLNARGTWQMLKVNPKQLHRLQTPFLPKDCIVRYNMPATLARIMSRAVGEDNRLDLRDWCDQNNLRHNEVKAAINDFLRSCTFSKYPLGDLEKLDFDPAALASHMVQHPLFESVNMLGEKQATYDMFPHFYDKTAAIAFDPLVGYHRTWGVMERIVVTDSGFQFNSVSLPITRMSK